MDKGYIERQYEQIVREWKCAMQKVNRSGTDLTIFSKC